MIYLGWEFKESQDEYGGVGQNLHAEKTWRPGIQKNGRNESGAADEIELGGYFQLR